MEYLLALIALMLVATPAMAEIVYSEQFYANENKSFLIANYASGSIGSFTAAGVYEQRNTNELLMKQNELLQEQNNLTATQNEILRRIYDALIHFRPGNMITCPNPENTALYPPLDI